MSSPLSQIDHICGDFIQYPRSTFYGLGRSHLPFFIITVETPRKKKLGYTTFRDR